MKNGEGRLIRVTLTAHSVSVNTGNTAKLIITLSINAFSEFSQVDGIV